MGFVPNLVVHESIAGVRELVQSMHIRVYTISELIIKKNILKVYTAAM